MTETLPLLNLVGSGVIYNFPGVYQIILIGTDRSYVPGSRRKDFSAYYCLPGLSAKRRRIQKKPLKTGAPDTI